jgi:hypothetical protein
MGAEDGEDRRANEVVDDSEHLQRKVTDARTGVC